MPIIEGDALSRARENQAFNLMSPNLRTQLLKFLSDNGLDGMDGAFSYPNYLSPAVDEYYQVLAKKRVYGEGQVTPHFDTSNMKINI